MERRPPAGYTRRVRSAMRRDTSPFPRSPVSPPFRTPFPNRKKVRRLFAEEEWPWSAGPRRVIPAGYGAQCAATNAAPPVFGPSRKRLVANEAA